MAFRGFFALNGVEIVNSSRVVAHLGSTVPETDYGMFSPVSSGDMLVEDPLGSGLFVPESTELAPGLFDPEDMPGSGGLYTPVDTDDECSIVESSMPGLYVIPPSSVEVSTGLWTPPDGSRRFGPGLYDVGVCWGPPAVCSGCRSSVGYDDSWPGLREFLGADSIYRPELAPWYTTEIPESGEFGGVWLMNVTGLDSTPVERPVTQTVGHGGVAGPYRDAARTVTFEALLLGCTNAGVEFGVEWLACLLRDTNNNTDTLLKYFTASPSNTDADPTSLLREAHNVVLTKAPEVTERINTYSTPNHHGNLYRITWDMSVLSPYSYFPRIPIIVDWDRITRQPINWIHAADCAKPENCEDMPVMFSTECVPEEIEKIETPPPVCGGCMPVSAIDKYSFRVPTMDYAFRCRETAVSVVLKNISESPLTLQAFWRVCGTDVRCEDNQWPLQVSGLPAGAELHLDGVTGRFKAWYDERWRKPVGVVGTPNGAPWRPPVIDRRICWDFIIQAAPDSEFEVSMSLLDREA